MVYKILEIFPKDKKIEIKCERRYNDFYLFSNRLHRIHPYTIIPELETNLISKFYKDENFYRKRKNQMNVFIKIIYNHEEIKNTKEFKKFINTNFDSEFFNEDESFYKPSEFPESIRNRSLRRLFFDFVKNKIPFINKENSYLIDQDSERDFLRKSEFYKYALDTLKDLQKYVVLI